MRLNTSELAEHEPVIRQHGRAESSRSRTAGPHEGFAEVGSIGEVEHRRSPLSSQPGVLLVGIHRVAVGPAGEHRIIKIVEAAQKRLVGRGVR